MGRRLPALLLLADNFHGIGLHLNHRDVTLVVVSRAPIAKIEPFKKRMGWGFQWVSSFTNSFNYDYHVSFTSAEIQTKTAFFNCLPADIGNVVALLVASDGTRLRLVWRVKAGRWVARNAARTLGSVCGG